MVDFSFQNRVQETIKRVDDILDLKVNSIVAINFFYTFLQVYVISKRRGVWNKALSDF